MLLKDYLNREQIGPSEFARRIMVDVSTVNRYLTGKRIPDREIMVTIIEATNGEVTANDFYSYQQI